jgi:hypothetical protein
MGQDHGSHSHTAVDASAEEPAEYPVMPGSMVVKAEAEAAGLVREHDDIPTTSASPTTSGGAYGPDAERLSALLGLLADPVHVRILFALVSVHELCVGDLARPALTLDVSMHQSSYALKQLGSAGLVQCRRDGRAMYYRLADGFPQQLLDHCLCQLLTIANQESTS